MVSFPILTPSSSSQISTRFLGSTILKYTLSQSVCCSIHYKSRQLSYPVKYLALHCGIGDCPKDQLSACTYCHGMSAMYVRASLFLSLSGRKGFSVLSEGSFDSSYVGPLTKELSLLSHEKPRTEGYDEYFDPPTLESKYEYPTCLLGLREPVQTSCGHRFYRGCIVRSVR